MSDLGYEIIIRCNEAAKDNLEPLLKTLQALGDMGCTRDFKVCEPDTLSHLDLEHEHTFDGDGPDRITDLHVRKDTDMNLKSSLIRLGSEQPELRPYLRKVLASLEKAASKSSLALLHARFVSQVEAVLDDLSRTSPVDGSSVRLQLSLSVSRGHATLLYQAPWHTRMKELDFPVTSSPEVVALLLMTRLNDDLKSTRRSSSDKPLTRRELDTLAKANVYLMDVEMDGGVLPPRIQEISELRRRYTLSESREILDYFYHNAPGNY